MVWLIRLYFIILVFLLFSKITNADDLNDDEKMVFNFVDLDNDDRLSSMEIDQSINLIFQLVDINKDGFISKTEIIELKNIINSLK
tara:strand:+ start:246 stop:503 length:258 start_codon:yes stop_codon:yes gene_type:complete